MSTAEERAEWRNDAKDGYQDNSLVRILALLDELEAAEEQANLFAALVEEYSAENTKLREQIEDLQDELSAAITEAAWENKP